MPGCAGRTSRRPLAAEKGIAKTVSGYSSEAGLEPVGLVSPFRAQIPADSALMDAFFLDKGRWRS